MEIEKLIQTVNYILKKYDYKLNYTKLIKLIYLADKEALKDSDDTITGDNYVSMENGPVLSSLYDLIRNKLSDTEYQNTWNKYFKVDGYNLLALHRNIPNDELSDFEMQILDKIDNKFHDATYGKMIDYLHDNCPEWKNTSSSIPIPLGDILKSIGRTTEEIEFILQERDIFEKEKALFRNLATP